MRVYKKYTCTALFSSLLYVLSNNLCQCDVNFQPENEKLVSSDDVSIDNEDIDRPVNKRGWNKNFAVWGKRDWQNFHSWGKRDDLTDDLSIAQLTPEKRKWAKFTSWGKRDMGLTDDTDWSDELDEDKRKFENLAEPLMVDRLWPNTKQWAGMPQDSAVDKRKWSNLAVWGKRTADSNLEDMVKKWAKFTSWGKRAGDQDINEVDKRKWAQFASWGKRDAEGETVDDMNKRKWSTLAAWGKRAFDGDYGMDKRKWAKFSSWGKRLRTPQAWLALNSGGKRRWSGLTTWGRR